MEAPKATEEVQQSDYGSDTHNERMSSQGEDEESKHTIDHIGELEDPIEIENRSS